MSVPATPLAIRLPISVEPVKATLSTPGWVTSAIPISPGPGDDVDDAGRQVGLAADVGEEERGQRRRRGGLEDDRVAGARAGAIFQASISSGKFHGMIWAATPSGRATRPGNAYSSLSAQPA